MSITTRAALIIIGISLLTTVALADCPDQVPARWDREQLVACLSDISTLRREVKALQQQRLVGFVPVGTVVSSFLPPAQFAKATGEVEGDNLDKRTWILADGRDVTGTEYARITGNKPLPNLKGMFVRSIDPQSSTEPGSFQDYATAIPKKNFTGITSASGTHTHAGGAGFSSTDQVNVGGDKYHVAGPADTKPGGEHDHTVDITGGGDTETRPKNVSLYFYIRIN